MLKGKDGLLEAPRRGRPRRITDEARLQLVALACEPAKEKGRTIPTLDDLRERAADRGIVTSLSHTSTDHLKARTLAWFTERNEAPKPFKWSFRGYHLQTGESKKAPGKKPDGKSSRSNRSI